jgi:hypothetical protein
MKKVSLATLSFGLWLVAIPALASDPTGVWKSSITLNGQTWESTLRLSFDTEGRVLSGVLDDGNGTHSAPLTKTKWDGRKVHFLVEHDVKGEKVSVNYNGAFSRDSITGKATFEYGDRSQLATWTASRQK